MEPSEIIYREIVYRRILARDVLHIEEERISVSIVPIEGTRSLVEILVDGKDPEGEHLERLRAHAREYGGKELAEA
jgi:hypothetical protein